MTGFNLPADASIQDEVAYAPFTTGLATITPTMDTVAVNIAVRTVRRFWPLQCAELLIGKAAFLDRLTDVPQIKHKYLSAMREAFF